MTTATAAAQGVASEAPAHPPQEAHGHGAPHGGDHDAEHHGTVAPLVVSAGLGLALTGLILNPGVMLVGLAVFAIGFWLWAQEYLRTTDDEKGDIATHWPFQGLEVRKVGMWVFLMTEMMIFSSLISVYLRYRWTAGADWQPAATHLNLPLGALNTFILISSSFTLAMALDGIRRGKHQRMMFGLAMTMLCGILFLLIKGVEWYEMIYLAPHGEPFTPWGSLEGTTFYVTTGTHGAHVFGGVVVLGFLLWKGSTGTLNAANNNSIEYFGLYWHFIDIVWALPIFPFFYLV